MKTIYIEIEEKSALTKKESQAKHLWYDIKSKEMKVIVGGSLRFKYDIDKEEMVPYTEDSSISVYEKISNRKTILDWIKTNNRHVSINLQESNDHAIAIEFDDEDENSVLSLLYAARFRYS